ncbi:unnamed protein product [Prunus armeniaca]|uniref:CCHC-type domain-containing protein n=1 Tax=Prunus armeniaca TaxID=36596 RepID=A0A6J5XEK4_PRUAR|nr:unnamed protein product [Prunus armeniaca]
MTRAMGRQIGEVLGNYIISDQSKRGVCVGSYLRVRVALDVTKPLRRCLYVRLGDGIEEVVRVEIRYEKLPHTCYLCGRLDHMEKDCSKYAGEGLSDIDKPYGKWFQEDVFQPDYRRPPGRRFGLASKPWSMHAPATVDDEEEDEEEMVAGARRRHSEKARADVDKNQGDLQRPQVMAGCAVTDVIMSDAEIPLLVAGEGAHFPLPDLNITLEVNAEDESRDSRAIIPYEENSIKGGVETLKPIRQLHEEGFALSTTFSHSFGLVTKDCGPRMEDVGQDDPFGLGPIIQQISWEAKKEARRKSRRGIKKQRSMHKWDSRPDGEVNHNGKRGPRGVRVLEGAT